MEQRVQKWGNSLGVRIPKSMAEAIGLVEGMPVELEVDDNSILIRTKKYDLTTLLAAVTTENLQTEIDTGIPVGREAW